MTPASFDNSLANRVPLSHAPQHVLGYAERSLASAVSGALFVTVYPHARFSFKHASYSPPGESEQLCCFVDAVLSMG
jgi:hypothetical protein